jgi:hypothetical protein
VETLRHLLEDLGSERFVVRDKAMRELELLQELAAPALRKVQQQPPNLEVQWRAEQLLVRIAPDKVVGFSERLRWLRALEVLERIGTPEAAALLRSLAAGADDVRLVREARAALGRLQSLGAAKLRR